MMAQMATQFSASMATMADRISQLEDSSRTPANPTPSVTPAPVETTTSANPYYRPKPRLTDPERFDGANTSFFPQFTGLLEAKLQIDAASIGNEKERV